MAKHVVTILGITEDLLKALQAAYDDTNLASRERTGQRAQFDKAVARHLDQVVELLRDHGFVKGRTKKQRRKVNRNTWDQLADAEKKVDVSRPSLLRACLRLELLGRKKAPGGKGK